MNTWITRKGSNRQESGLVQPKTPEITLRNSLHRNRNNCSRLRLDTKQHSSINNKELPCLRSPKNQKVPRNSCSSSHPSSLRSTGSSILNKSVSVILTMTTCCRARKKSTQKVTKRSTSALSRRSSRPISSKKPSLIPSFMAKKGLQGTQLSSTSRPAPAKKWSITYSIVLKSCEFQSQFSSSTTLTKNTKTSSTTRTHRCL